MLKRGQGFTEYTLLVGISIIAILLTVSSFLRGSVLSSFTSHFNRVKGRIMGGGG